MLFEDVYYEWMETKSNRVKKSTIENYEQKWKCHIGPRFASDQITDIKPSDVNKFISTKFNQGLSKSYINDMIVMLKSIFKFADMMYDIPNIMQKIPTISKNRSAVRILTDDELKILDNYIFSNPSCHNIGILIAQTTGLRLGELCALKWEDIDLSAREAYIHKTLRREKDSEDPTHTKLMTTEPKTQHSRRHVPIPPQTFQMMLKFYDGDDEKYVCSGKYKPLDPRTIEIIFSKILKSAGLPHVHFHSLRHKFATHCIELGFDIKSLSEILGHANIKITLEKYIHSSMDHKKNLMNMVTF